MTRLAAYLAQTGWTEDARLRDLATIWHRPESERLDAEVVVPSTENVKDFEERIEDALAALATFESRSIQAIEESIRDSEADVVRVRVVHADVESGSIPLEDGVVLNEKARDLMLSAAMSTVARRKMFLGARGDITNSYMKTLRLGQTSIGSYVINVIAPIAREPDEMEAQRPFSRSVTENLNGALRALSDAVEKYNKTADLGVFDLAVEQGVSMNMCDALVGMSGQNRSRKLLVSLVTSPMIPNTIESNATFVFGAETLPAIQAAAEYFREDYVLLNRTIRGYVKRLDRLHGDETGTVAITAVLFGKNEKNVRVELSAENYALAIQAHDQDLLVEIHGDIHVTPRTATMTNASGFRVFTSGDLF